MTKVDKNSVEKIANHVASAVNKNNVTPVGFWNREIWKVGGVSITPKRLAIGTGAVLGTATVLYIGYKWCKRLTQQPLTIPPAGSSSKPSVEETNAIEKVITTMWDLDKTENTLRKEIIDTESQEYRAYIENENNSVRQNIDVWSTKTTSILSTVANKIKINNMLKTAPSVETEVELAENEYAKNNYIEHDNDEWLNALAVHENIAKFVKTNETKLPRNLRNCIKKFTSANVMATRLATLRKIGLQWDTEEIRQNLSDRKLKINEEVAFNTIMATLEKRILNKTKAISTHNIKNQIYPDALNAITF
jgi:hypothetical protein